MQGIGQFRSPDSQFVVLAGLPDNHLAVLAGHLGIIPLIIKSGSQT